MKIWEKVYSVVIILFVVVLNVCGLMIMGMTYGKNVEGLKQISASTWKKIAVSFGEDLAASDMSNDSTMKIFQGYVRYYYNNGMTFELWKNGRLYYMSEPEGQKTYFSNEGELISDFMEKNDKNYNILCKTDNDKDAGETDICKTLIISSNSNKYACSAGKISGTDYTFILYENVSESLGMWPRMIKYFVIIEIAASVIIAILVYMLIKKLLKPVEKLSQAASHIAEGDYDIILHEEGHDEIASLARDINYMTNEIKKSMTEKQNEVNTKQEFVDALAHELRTPLTTIKGYSQLLMNASLSDEKQIEYAGYIVGESGRMLDMAYSLKKVLLLRESDIAIKSIAIEELINDVMPMLYKIIENDQSESIKNKSVVLKETHLNETITCNKELTELLIINLVKNAYNACEDGDCITINLSKEMIEVSDNGVGMSEECIRRICEPYYREDKSRSRKNGGTGLGMYICKNILDIHGWKMNINSKKGKGSRIKVSFIE